MEAFSSILQAFKNGQLTYDKIIEATSLYIEYNRNNIVKTYLEKFANKEEYLLMSDTDICFNDRAIPKMLWTAKLTGSPVVFGNAALSQYGTTAFKRTPERYEPIWPLPEGDYFESDGFATAFCLFHKSLWSKIQFPWFETGYVGDKFQGEDFVFSDKLMGLGIKPICVKYLELAHCRVIPIGAIEDEKKE